jgi:hypothetical protein
MSNTEISSLLTRLHDSFGDNAPSPQIQQLMKKMQEHLHESSKPAEGEPDISDTASTLLAEVEAEHPDATAIVLNMIETLDKMGI